MSEIFCLLQSVSSLGCDAATYASTACGCNAWGSLSSSSNKLSNEGNYSGKKAVGLGNPSKLGSIRGGRGDGLQPPPAPPPEPLPSPSGPSSSGRFKASSLLLIFSSSAALNSFFLPLLHLFDLHLPGSVYFHQLGFEYQIFFGSLNVTLNSAED